MWIELFKKKGLNAGQARKLVHDKNAWWVYVKGNALGHRAKD